MATSAHAVDHANLDQGRPLRLADAYAIAAREIVLETGFRLEDHRRGDDQGVFPIELLWGAAPNLQLGVGSAFWTNPNHVDSQSKSGDVRLSALYNFNQETSVPAFAVRGELNLPIGVDSSGLDGEIAAIITKSVGSVSIHFNAAYELLNGTMSGEKSGLYKFALGASLPIGAPMHTRTLLLADVFLEEALTRGADNIIGIEAGIRHQLTERIVVDGGIGTEFDGAADRARIFAVFGVSVTF